MRFDCFYYLFITKAGHDKQNERLFLIFRTEQRNKVTKKECLIDKHNSVRRYNRTKMAAASKTSEWTSESKDVALNKKIAELKKRIVLAGKIPQFYFLKNFEAICSIFQRVKRKQRTKNGWPKRKKTSKPYQN